MDHRSSFNRAVRNGGYRIWFLHWTQELSVQLKNTTSSTVEIRNSIVYGGIWCLIVVQLDGIDSIQKASGTHTWGQNLPRSTIFNPESTQTRGLFEIK